MEEITSDTIIWSNSEEYIQILQKLSKEITRQLKDELLITPHLKLVAKGSLPVQEGKAVRVKDLRKLS